MNLGNFFATGPTTDSSVQQNYWYYELESDRKHNSPSAAQVLKKRHAETQNLTSQTFSGLKLCSGTLKESNRNKRIKSSIN